MDYHNLHLSLEKEFDGVVGVGKGYKVINGEKTKIMSHIILVEKKLPINELHYTQIMPRNINGLQTDIIGVGKIFAYENTERVRPVVGGVSVGHKNITAGTVATLVYDGETSEPLLLSNNHVLAMSNDAEIGDEIYQPGPADGGTVDDMMANLFKYIPIKFSTPDIPDIPGCDVAKLYINIGNSMAKLVGSRYRVFAYEEDEPGLEPNFADAAVAKPINITVLSSHIKDIGVVNGTADAFLNQQVYKSGRTTELTHGEVQALNMSITVSYGGLKAAYFTDQVVIVGTVDGQAFSAPGDSGSLVLEKGTNNAVGLLFAGGSGSDKAATIISPIHYVLDGLNVTF